MKAPVCGSFDSDADPFRQWSAVAVPVAASMASHYVWVRTETVESNACPLSGVRDSDLNGRYAARLRHLISAIDTHGHQFGQTSEAHTPPADRY